MLLKQVKPESTRKSLHSEHTHTHTPRLGPIIFFYSSISPNRSEAPCSRPFHRDPDTLTSEGQSMTTASKTNINIVTYIEYFKYSTLIPGSKYTMSPRFYCTLVLTVWLTVCTLGLTVWLTVWFYCILGLYSHFRMFSFLDHVTCYLKENKLQPFFEVRLLLLLE